MLPRQYYFLAQLFISLGSTLHLSSLIHNGTAYREGVVITVCKGCNSKHLIADNLGWTKFAGGFTDGETNIEEFLEARGEKVSKVSKDVWELEKLFYTKETREEEKDTQ